MIEKLSKNSLFEGVEQEYLQMLVANRVEVNLPPKDFLFHQGDEGRGMYIVLDGEIAVVLETEKNRAPREVAALRSGDYVGEVCMLEPQKRTAGVVSKSTAKLMYLDSKKFDRDIEEGNANALRIAYNIALRLYAVIKKTNELLGSKEGLGLLLADDKLRLESKDFRRGVAAGNTDNLRICYEIALRLSEVIKETNKLLTSKDSTQLLTPDEGHSVRKIIAAG